MDSIQRSITCRATTRSSALAYAWALAASVALSPAAAGAVEASINLNPRLESAWGPHEEQTRRTFLKAQASLKSGNFGLSTEGFVEHDFAEYDQEPLGQPDFRRTRSTGYLQEAYLDYQLGPVFFRAGRQPVRWSQSWTVPSLDIFTGRRWNRLFLDPVAEQLIHPDGVLISYAGSTLEAELFQAIRPAENTYPQPFPVEDRKTEAQTGARVRLRMKGLDVSLVGRRTADETMIGAAASYAFDCCVIKTEAGQSADTRGFVIAGVDVFWEELTFTPQFTWYQDPILTNDKVETVAYAPLRYTYGKYAFEAQYYRNLQFDDAFAALMISRDLFSEWKVSAYVQNYDGEKGRLFGIYRDLTGGTVYGLRLELNHSL